ncbi:CPBP family intramembrane glutamic endopeptidase [Candidatus Omnitrophota bacterium]
MKIKKQPWLSLIIASLFSIIIWFQFSYPQLEIMNFSVDKTHALAIAQEYLQQQNIDTEPYNTAIVFDLRGKANTYLQKTLGAKKLKAFIKENDFNLFQWKIRFFQEGEVEEHIIHVSSSTGEIIRYKHFIDPSAKREAITKEEARQRGLTFLTDTFSVDEANYYLLESREEKFDFRTDYEISWAKKGIEIPWNENVEEGTGKILNIVLISGKSILRFWKNAFRIPAQFNRHLEKLDDTGRTLGSFSILFFYSLLAAAVYFVVMGHQHLSLQITKPFYLSLAGIAFLLSSLSNINQLQEIIFYYKTSSPLAAALWRYFIDTTLKSLFFSINLIIPFLAAEYLHAISSTKNKQHASFFYYLRTSFLTRTVSKQIWIGYFICIIMLGIQSLLIKFGQNYLNVWVTQIWIERLSSASFPFITALSVSLFASLNEEALYRFFAIKWGEKLFKNIWIPIIISALIWGFSHSAYPVYPKWFRGVELTAVGIFLGFSYTRFGIIPVIIAHFLFDIFWHCAGYLMGHSTPLLFFGSLALLFIPFAFSLVAFLINKEAILTPIKKQFSKIQLFNCTLLKEAFKAKKQHNQNYTTNDFESELKAHNWDPAIIKAALYEDNNNTENSIH